MKFTGTTFGSSKNSTRAEYLCGPRIKGYYSNNIYYIIYINNIDTDEYIYATYWGEEELKNYTSSLINIKRYPVFSYMSCAK
jgi:hypothetical protein